MKFVDNIKKDDYINFFNKNKNSHFLQSYAWGQTNEKTRGKEAVYVGIIDEKENILCETLLLKKKTPFNMCYFYAPRGFIIDYKNTQLLEFFVNELKSYLKRKNAIYMRVNPGIKYQDIDENAIPVKNGDNNYELFNKFLELGFIHQGFNKLYESNEPRYTFRINLNPSLEEIEKKMNHSFLKAVKKSYDYDLEIRESGDIDTFYKLINNNAKKDNFNAYPLKFYKTFYKEFSKENEVKIFEALLYPDKVIKSFEIKLKEMKKKISESEAGETKIIDDINIHNRLEKDLEIFKPLKAEFPNGLVVCSLVCVYTKLGAWTLYIGNDYLGTKTSSVNRLYYESIVNAKKRNFQFMDLFGTIGDPKSTYKNLSGIYEFKRKMGGEYLEFFGDFDLVNKKTWYKTLPSLLKIYRSLKKH